VRDDLLAGLAADPDLRGHFAPGPPPAGADLLDEEEAAVEAFVAERGEQFVLGTRSAVLNRLLAHVGGPRGARDPGPTGAPGSGKSALLAHLSRHPGLPAGPSALVVRHFAGATPGSSDPRLTLARLCRAAASARPDAAGPVPDDPEALTRAWPELLRRA